MKFVQALILGTGRLPLDCALALREKNMPVAIYDCDQAPSGILKDRRNRKKLHITTCLRRNCLIHFQK